MKKSSTTMNVPANTTGRGAQGLAVTGLARRPARQRDVNDDVLMAATMPGAAGVVDYLVGKPVTWGVIDRSAGRCQAAAR
jgi:hypothetical protein